MRNQNDNKDNWDILRLDLGLESTSEQKTTEITPVAVIETVIEESVPKEYAAAEAAVTLEKIEETVETAAYETDTDDFFGAGILDEPVKIQRKSKTVAVQKIEIPERPEKDEKIEANPVVSAASKQETIPQGNVTQDSPQNPPQREQKKSFLGRFAKMTFFGTPAKEQPVPAGKNQRHSVKAVTSFASKTVETAAVPLNRIVKPENSVQNLTADTVSEEKELPDNTEQSSTEGNPWGKIVSQIESRSENLEQHREEDMYAGKKHSRRLPSSMFADEPIESKEARALKNIIDNKETREYAEERLNSIFNCEDNAEKHRGFERNEYISSSQQKHKDRRESRSKEPEERKGYPQRTHGKRGAKFNQRLDIEEQEYREDISNFSSEEEQEDTIPAERFPKLRTSRCSRSGDKQDFQGRKKEKRIISGHFSNDTDEFTTEETDEVFFVDPGLIQAAKSALGWDAAVSGIIEGNLRRHQSGSGNNYRQTRR